MFYIVVNKHIVRANKNKIKEEREAPFRISNGKHGKPFYAWNVEFYKGITRLVYDPENPMPCGASVWIEAEEIYW